MGAFVRPREFDVDQPSHTEELANWINRIRSKKMICRRNRKRDLRVEAVLTYSLTRAELELRSKQMTRFRRWQQMKSELMKESGQLFSNGAKRFAKDCILQSNPWQGPLCSELSSLDSFMTMLKEVKAPLQR